MRGAEIQKGKKNGLLFNFLFLAISVGKWKEKKVVCIPGTVRAERNVPHGPNCIQIPPITFCGLCAYFKKWMDFIGINSGEGKTLILRHRRSGTKYLVIMKSAGVGQACFVTAKVFPTAQSLGTFCLTFNQVASQTLLNQRHSWTRKQITQARRPRKKKFLMCSKLLLAHGMTPFYFMGVRSSIRTTKQTKISSFSHNAQLSCVIHATEMVQRFLAWGIT